jgi:hypothetical protein
MYVLMVDNILLFTTHKVDMLLHVNGILPCLAYTAVQHRFLLFNKLNRNVSILIVA